MPHFEDSVRNDELWILPKFDDGLTVAEAQRFAAAIRRPAAIDSEGVAVDESALCVICEKQNRVRNIVGRSETAHGHAVRNVAIGVTSGGLIGYIHFGLDPARTDGIHANAAAAPLCRECACETISPCFEAL